MLLIKVALLSASVFASELVWLEDSSSQTDAPFTIATKNVLANDWAWPKYYPYATAETLSWNTRFPAHIKELKSYNADVLTLQEIDRVSPILTGETYRDGQPSCDLEGHWGGGGDFLPSMDYNLAFAEQNPKHIGVLVAHKNVRWAEIGGDSIRLTDATSHLPDVHPYAALCVVLSDRLAPGREIIVCTTHLFYASAAIRSHQAILLLREIQKLREEYPNAPVLLSGDFNMRPTDCAHKLITHSAEISEDAFWEDVQKPSMANDRGSNPAFDWAAAKDEILYGALSNVRAKDLFMPLNFATTHRTATFDAVLDYIFAIPALNGQEVRMIGYKPLPTSSEVLPMPNEKCPSDHLALFAVLTYA